MGKKKRQSDHSQLGDSSDSNEENEGKNGGTNCLHINKGILLSAVRKVLKTEGLPRDCNDCKRGDGREKLVNGHTDKDGEEEDEENLFICLRCGHCGCHSNNGPKHGLNHSVNRQADVHDLAINPESWAVWCFKCNMEIPPNSTKQLLECVEFVKKRGNRIVGEQEDSKESADSPERTTYTASIVIAPILSDGLPRVRGLANMGNTCFMNAVLQCLAQTPFLLPVLEEMSQPGETFKLPGGEVTIGEDKEYLDPLEGTLGKWGSLSVTAALADVLQELQSGSSDVLVPSVLRTRFTAKCPQFAGYAEHDSHELLRQLLDTVRTEDLDRYKSGILEKLNLDKKSEREIITDRLKRITKGYGRQAGDLLLRPSKVFRGDLVSTLVCQKCRHATDHVEHFLDLSLPVVSDKPVHVRRRVTEDISKHQLKKDRKMNTKRKNRRMPKPNNLDSAYGEPTNDENASATLDQDNVSNGSEEDDSDADDEVEEDGVEPRGRDVVESGYSSEKHGNGDSGSGSPSNAPRLPCASPNSLDNDMCGLTVDSDSPVMAPLLSDSPVDAGVNGLGEAALEGAIALPPPPSPEPVVPCNGGGTMAPRVYATSGECTLITCLNQFTAQELLTGNNKVGCEACTEKANGKKGATVYTDASKQLLVLNPPAILILHLKRFQVLRFAKKNSEEVKFPPILDLAPFCSTKARNTPTVDKNQTMVRYALYGIVQHSGSMHGGHYVAYVKVRPALARDDPRWAFLPTGSTPSPCESPEEPSETSCEPPDAPPGKWYYVSDSHVTDVRESRVFDSEAYLLFYERIW